MKYFTSIARIGLAILVIFFSACGVRAVEKIETNSGRESISFVVNEYRIALAVPSGGTVIGQKSGRFTVQRSENIEKSVLNLYVRKYGRRSRWDETGDFSIVISVVPISPSAGKVNTISNLAAEVRAARSSLYDTSIVEKYGSLWVRQSLSQKEADNASESYFRLLGEDAYVAISFRSSSKRMLSDPQWAAMRKKEMDAVVNSLAIEKN